MTAPRRSHSHAPISRRSRHNQRPPTPTNAAATSAIHTRLNDHRCSAGGNQATNAHISKPTIRAMPNPRSGSGKRQRHNRPNAASPMISISSSHASSGATFATPAKVELHAPLVCCARQRSTVSNNIVGIGLASTGLSLYTSLRLTGSMINRRAFSTLQRSVLRQIVTRGWSYTLQLSSARSSLNGMPSNDGNEVKSATFSKPSEPSNRLLK